MFLALRFTGLLQRFENSQYSMQSYQATHVHMHQANFTNYIEF